MDVTQSASSQLSVTVSQPKIFYSLPIELKKLVQSVALQWQAENKTGRLWQGDPSLWTAGSETRWLGWLHIVDRQLEDRSRFKALAAEVREDGFTHFLLLGTGAVSSCVELLRPNSLPLPGSPELLILNSTDPAQIAKVRNRIDPATTLFCICSRSETALEPHVYLQYFFEETTKAVGDAAGHHFIAITEPESEFEALASSYGFRRVFYTDPAISEHYAALSDVGLVPHAAVGLDTQEFLESAAEAVTACKNSNPANNPGLFLGLLLGAAATSFGRNKITLICSDSLLPLGGWLAQLLSAVTNPDGNGLIPVEREPLLLWDENNAELYGSDRVFVHFKLTDDDDKEIASKLAALEQLKQPVVRVVLDDLLQLGQVFFQWQFAAAVAGSLIGANPFAASRPPSNGGIRLASLAIQQSAHLPVDKPILEVSGMALFVNGQELSKDGHSLGSIIRRHLDRLQKGTYFALVAYLPAFPEYEAQLQRIRKAVLEALGVATVLVFGADDRPWSGQAFHNARNSGVFLYITSDDAKDLAIPHQEYTFGRLKAAQARDSFQTLSRNAPALRVHLGKDIKAGLERLHDVICAAIEH